MLKIFKKYGRNAHYYKLIHRIFGVWASNIELYKLALVHRSASVDLGDGRQINNERLEFLGDSVLQLLISEVLFVAYPDVQEGMLSRYRSRVVCRRTLNALAEELNIKHEIFSATISNPDVLGNTFEALCGALYLDCGFDKASLLLLKLFDKHMDLDEVFSQEFDHKSRMLEWAQHNGCTVTFETTTASSGGFVSKVLVEREPLGTGTGQSKKAAEQAACEAAAPHLL